MNVTLTIFLQKTRGEKLSNFHTVIRTHVTPVHCGKREVLFTKNFFCQINSLLTYFVKPLLSRNFGQKCVRTVWKSTIKAIMFKKFREINYLVIHLVKTLIWRLFHTTVRENSRNFRTVSVEIKTKNIIMILMSFFPSNQRFHEKCLSMIAFYSTFPHCVWE